MPLLFCFFSSFLFLLIRIDALVILLIVLCLDDALFYEDATVAGTKERC